MKDIKSMTLAELGTELKALGEPAFRAKQIYRWMHRGVWFAYAFLFQRG